ncbi:uncharacterized protein [Argopecten irradians]|uniref:uncharacterized protein n=1 Tax=Argopecten irradians TaxID=31199 RepID=UPI00371D64E9
MNGMASGQFLLNGVEVKGRTCEVTEVGLSEFKCFKCKGQGHFARNCTTPPCTRCGIVRADCMCDMSPVNVDEDMESSRDSHSRALCEVCGKFECRCDDDTCTGCGQFICVCVEESPAVGNDGGVDEVDDDDDDNNVNMEEGGAGDDDDDDDVDGDDEGSYEEKCKKIQMARTFW